MSAVEYYVDAGKRIEREAAAAWIKEKWAENGDCARCRSNNWSIGDVYEMRIFRPPLLQRSAIFPVFPMTCLVCGTVVFVNAVIAGVLKDPE